MSNLYFINLLITNKINKTLNLNTDKTNNDGLISNITISYESLMMFQNYNYFLYNYVLPNGRNGQNVHNSADYLKKLFFFKL